MDLVGRGVGVIPEDHAHAHEREHDREAEKNSQNEQADHQQPDFTAAHDCVSCAPAACAATSASCLRGKFALMQDCRLELFDVLPARRPFAAAQTDDAAEDFGEPLNQQQGAADRDQGLQRENRNIGGAENADLVVAPGFAGIDVTGEGQRQDARIEEQNVEHQIDGGLHARRPQPIDHVATNVGVARQRVGASHEEQRAVHVVGKIVGPDRRVIEHVANEDLIGGAEGQDQNVPAEGLSDRRIDAIDDRDIGEHGLLSVWRAAASNRRGRRLDAVPQHCRVCFQRSSAWLSSRAAAPCRRSGCTPAWCRARSAVGSTRRPSPRLSGCRKSS